MLRALHTALTFMTTLPLPTIKNWQDADAKRSLKAYPLVGLLIGFVLLLAYGLTQGFSDFIQAVLLLALWLGVTGALHFDGFCDMADAVFAAKPAQERQKIAKDVSVGAFALAAGAILLLIKVAALASLSHSLWLIFIPLAARTLLLLAIKVFKVNGSSLLGQRLKENGVSIRFPLTMGLGFMIVIALFTHTLAAVLLLILATAVFVMALAFFLTRRMDGLSGDAYGAIIESSEAFMLLWVSLL